MRNRRFHRIEYFQTLGTPESERLKVTALNLFHPTASPLVQKIGFFILRHSLFKGRVGEGMGSITSDVHADSDGLIQLQFRVRGFSFLPEQPVQSLLASDGDRTLL